MPIFIGKLAKLYQKSPKLNKTAENAEGAEKYIIARPQPPSRLSFLASILLFQELHRFTSIFRVPYYEPVSSGRNCLQIELNGV